MRQHLYHQPHSLTFSILKSVTQYGIVPLGLMAILTSYLTLKHPEPISLSLFFSPCFLPYLVGCEMEHAAKSASRRTFFCCIAFL